MPAPDVDDDLAADVHDDARAQLLAEVELPRERVLDRREARVGVAGYLHDAPSSSYRRHRWLTRSVRVGSEARVTLMIAALDAWWL